MEAQLIEAGKGCHGVHRTESMLFSDETHSASPDAGFGWVALCNAMPVTR